MIASVEVMLTFILLSIGGYLLTRHILTLMSATQQVAAGNHDIQIPISSSDEIGMLASNFNVMTGQSMTVSLPCMCLNRPCL